MNPQGLHYYRLAADVVLAVHALYVAFVVLGLACILAGGALRWAWVRNLWFRIIHLAAIGIVVVQSWFGLICPLTTWEMALRAKAGASVHSGGFIAHWLGKLLYFEAAPWVFALAYSVFGLLVAASWWWVPPRFRRARDRA